jgi:hypothetical protein
VFGLLEGRNLNLRVMERDDVDFMVDCFNNKDFWGDNFPATGLGEQASKSEWMKNLDNPPEGLKWFIIQKKDGTRIGLIWHMLN